MKTGRCAVLLRLSGCHLCKVRVVNPARHTTSTEQCSAKALLLDMLALAAARESFDMRCTCIHAWRVSRMIQLRNVSDSLHRTLKARAAMAGMSLSDYLVAEIRCLADRLTIGELRERLRRRARVSAPVSAAEAVRRERGAK